MHKVGLQVQYVRKVRKRRYVSELRSVESKSLQRTSRCAQLKMQFKKPGPGVLMQIFVKGFAVPVHEGYHVGNSELAANQAKKRSSMPKGNTW